MMMPIPMRVAYITTALAVVVSAGCGRGCAEQPAAKREPPVRTSPVNERRVVAEEGAACSSIGAAWKRGRAVDVDDGWDVSRCRPVKRDVAEIVKPAERDPERWGDVVCNDGSPFGFELQLSKESSRDWVIHLQGGGWCQGDARPCSEREERYTRGPEELDGALLDRGRGGIFSSKEEENPVFYDANRVYLRYCTSDLWTGTQAEPVPIPDLNEPWRFNGRRAVTATFEILGERYGFADDADARVLFSGGSAGAVGAVANADQLFDFVPNTVADGRAKVVTDGGFLPDFDLPGHRMDKQGRTDAEIMVIGYDIWGAQLNADCEAEQRDAGLHPSRCFLGFRSAPHLMSRGVPVLVQQSLHDKWAITNHLIEYDNPNHTEALKAWREASKSAFEPMQWVYSRGGPPYHTLITRDIKPDDGQAFGDVLEAFWRGDDPIRVVDDE